MAAQNGRKRFEGVSEDMEFRYQDKFTDTRSFGKKIHDNIENNPTIFNMIAIASVVAAIALPFMMDFVLFIFAVFSLVVFSIGSKKTLPFQTPMSSGTLQRYNVPEKKLKVGKYYDEDGEELLGMYYLGNDLEFSNREIWFSDSDVRTHLLLFGTTGAGKTEALLSLCYGSLLTCSGFIYSDGKGTFELFYKVYATCRSLGQEDDLLLMSFLTGDEDMRGATNVRYSNTSNPFADASADAASNMLVSLMSDGSGDGMWKDRASALMEAVMQMLCYRRDYHKQLISVNTIRESLILNNLYQSWADAKKCTDPNAPEYLLIDIVTALRGYLTSLPGFDENKPFEDQPDTINEQHGYLYMQFTKLLGSLGDMYGYIFNTQMSEINFWDVVTNRRVLVVLLPALAKSKNELSMLGKIIIACLKQMMESGLGKYSEGETQNILDTNPTKSETPFLSILDEYGYYAVQGAAVMPAQARGLGFFMVFAGQDFPAFAGPSPEEAKSIVANCKIQICMALQDEKETYNIFKDKLGSAEIAVNTGKEYIDGKLVNNKSVSFERRDRVSFRDLAGQDSGEAHFLYKDKLVRGRFLYVSIDISRKTIRVNQFIKVVPPEPELISVIKNSFDEIKKKITNIQYITNLVEEQEDDESQEQVINEISSLFSEYQKEHNSSTLASCATIAHILYNRNKLIEAEKEKRNILTENSFQTSFVKSDNLIDEEIKEYNERKKDINASPVKHFGQKASEMRETLTRRQMMASNNLNSVPSQVDKTIESLNNLSMYPTDSMPIKKPRELMEYIKELGSHLDEALEQIDDQTPI